LHSAISKVIVVGALALAACAPPSPLSAFERMLLDELAPPLLPSPPLDISNRFADDPRAAQLGQRLFFDPGLSGALLDGDNDIGDHTLGHRGDTGKVACAGCHIPTSGFLDSRTQGQQISLASGWSMRRTRPLLDSAQSKLLMWDGRRDAFYNQIFTPLESPVEMNSSRLFVAEQIFARYRADYEAIFGAMPPIDQLAQIAPSAAGCQPKTAGNAPAVCDGTQHGLPGDHAEYDALSPADQQAVTRVVVNMGKAIEAYLRLLSCGPGRFDKWVHGDAHALTEPEQRGAKLFIGKGRCVLCHKGAYFSDQQFHNVGLRPETVAAVFTDLGDRGAAVGLPAALSDPLNVRGVFSDGDDGRLPSTTGSELEGAFRTMPLRCVATRPSFTHTGQFTQLADAVRFFARGGDGAGYVGSKELDPTGLTDDEQSDLVAFLQSLNGPGPAAHLIAAP
jgi:cytochrome c peroxidase